VSTIKFLTDSTGKAGEKTLQINDLALELEGIKSGWLDILNPGPKEKIFMLDKLNFHSIAVEDCFAGLMLFYFYRKGWIGPQK